MIFKGRLASTPSTNVVIDGVTLNYLSIQTVKLMLGEDKHDTLVLSISGVDPKLVTQMLQRPVFAQLAVGASTHTFCGYVYSTNPVSKSREGQINRSPLQNTEVICLGMSSALRGKKARTWQDVTLSRIVNELSKTYQFSYSIPQDFTVLPRILQSEESDWELLVRVADFLGFSVNLHGSHLSIWDRNTYLARRSFYAEAFPHSTVKAARFDQPGMILELYGNFEPVSVYVADGVDILNTPTGRIGPFPRSTGAGKEVQTLYVNQRPINSATIGLSERTIKGTRKHTYPYKVHLYMKGICGVTPGSILSIKDYDSYFDGYWCVTEVTQTLRRDQFLTEVHAVRDTTNELPPSLPPAIKVSPVPAPLLIGGVWRSAKQLEETYA